MTTLHFVRHAETDWNRDGQIQGWADVPLSELGREQARELAATLGERAIGAIYSSDLSRARETARIVAEARGLDVTSLPELRERHFGSWEGLTDDEIHERFPEEVADGVLGDGESRDELDRRIVEALSRIADEHPAGTVLVVSHGGPLRAVLRHCGVNSVDRIANCHVLRLEAGGGVLQMD